MGNAALNQNELTEQTKQLADRLEKELRSGWSETAAKIHQELRDLISGAEVARDPVGFASALGEGLRRRLQELNGAAYTQQEIVEFDRDLVGITFAEFAARPQSWGRMLQLGSKEFRLARFLPGQRMLFIGCGAIPQAVLGMVLIDRAEQKGQYFELMSQIPDYAALPEETPPKLWSILKGLASDSKVAGRLDITCIDRSATACERACSLLERFEVKGVKVLDRAGEDLAELGKFDVIMFAGIVGNKAAIFREILARNILAPAGRLVIRNSEPDPVGALLYDPIDLITVQQIAQEHPGFQRILQSLPRGSSRVFAVTEVYERRA